MSLLLMVFAFGCAESECAGNRDLSSSAAGLTLTEQEHPAGWARTECFQCHQASRIHTESCVEGVAVDGDEINDQLDASDTTTCVQCHGDNGVAEWASLLDSGDNAL